MSTERPPQSSTQRYRLPVRPPVRLLLMACLSATVGSGEIVAWAAFRLPAFWLQAGVALIVAAAGLATWALVVHRRLRWTVHVSPDGLTVTRGSRRWQRPWSDIGGVGLVGARLVIRGRAGEPQQTLAVPPEALGSRVLAQMIDAIETRIGNR